MKKNSNLMKRLLKPATYGSLIAVSLSALSGCSLTEFVSGTPEATEQTNQQSASSTSAQSERTRNASSQVAEPTKQPKPAVTSKKRSVDEPYSMTSAPKVAQTRQGIQRPQSAQPMRSSTPGVYNQSQANSYQGSLAQHSLTGAEHSVLVEEYIERMATDLINNLATSNSRTKPVIGVTSFVDFNNNLKTVTPFGNRIAEHFINELQRSGFIVADFKVRDTISVGQNGDLVFSRNTQELNGAESMTHVLAGNIMYQEKGLKISARVVDFDHKWVIASSSIFMPYFILDSIVPSNAKHTVY